MKQISAEQLTAIIKQSGIDPVILFGAGASATSGVPMADDMSMQAARWAAAIDRGWQFDDPRIRESDVRNFLGSQPWFTPDMTVEDRYQHSMHLLNSPRELRRQFLFHVLNNVSEPSSGYHRLVHVVKARIVRTMLTANFDDRFEAAFGPGPLITISEPHEHQWINTAPPHPQLIHLHGKAEHYMDRIMEEEVQELDDDLISQVLPLLRDHPLIVIGYRGAEPSIMRSLLIEQLDNARKFPHGIFWCALEGTKPDDLAPMVKELAQKLQDNFALVTIEGFDQFMDEFSAQIEHGIASTPPEAGYPDTQAYDKLPLDTRPTERARFDDINETTLRRIATEHAARIGIHVTELPDQDWYHSRLTAIGLLTRDAEGDITPTNAAVLLCAENGREISPGHSVEISTPDRPPSSIDGSLVEIYETVFARLEEANRPIRVKGARSRYAKPYGDIALKELLANALIHRDYNSRDPVKVWIDKDFVQIESPGGLDAALIQQISSLVQTGKESSLGQEFRNRIFRGEIGRRFTAYRNPILAEAFWGLGYVDKAGSGLVDAVRSLEDAGATANLEIPPNNDRFIATASLAHLNIDESTKTARPRRPTIYWANVTNFLSVPDNIFSAKAKFDHPRETSALAGTRHLPSFSFRNGKLFTFSDLNEPNSPFAGVAYLNDVQRHSIDEIEHDHSLQTVLPELLKKALETRLFHCGLRVDRRRNRAYFRCDRHDAHYVNYTTMAGRQQRRRVARWPQKLNSGYCEHEAVNYEITQFGREWGLVLQPTFIITLDGVSDQLPGNEQASIVTRLQSDNYNRSVLADVRFWLKQLETSNGVIKIDTGSASVEISTSLLTFEGYSDNLEEQPDDHLVEG